MSKEILFNQLIARVSKCSLCPRMDRRTRVLGPNCGNLHSPIMFIGEAPGRFGADQTGVPFTGDQSGINFDELIKSINWKREMFFITNAVLCNPRDEVGNNNKPKDWEIKECSQYLNEIINIIQPKIIVTLGRKALRALYHIHGHRISLKKHVAIAKEWNHFIVFPLYHCSSKVFNIHRDKTLQKKDYQILHEYCQKHGLTS